MNQLVFLFLCLITRSSFGADNLSAPNMSANALFLYQNSNFHKENSDPANLDSAPNGLNVQEAELQFYSDVDPYTRLSLLLSVHPQLESNGTQIEEKWIIEPEEAFAESNVISNVTLRLGKFKAFMGKHNQLHTHAYPFIKSPLANEALLGGEGLNDVGASAAVLLPSSWYNEISLQYLRGKGENSEFQSPSPGDGVGLLHWKNLLDLSGALTFELGFSYARGNNSFSKETALSGTDLTFKWRPEAGGRYKSLLWSTEYLSRTQNQNSVPTEKGNGIATWLQYQFAERWVGLYRFDTLKIQESFNAATLPNDSIERHSLAIVYLPSEFSSFKFEYDQRHGGMLNSEGSFTEKSIFLQANFTIGAHPSHSY